MTVINPGVYEVSFSVTGALPSQFGVAVNGVVAPGGLYGTASISQNTGRVILSLAAGDIISLVSFGNALIIPLLTSVGGIGINANAALMINKLA